MEYHINHTANVSTLSSTKFHALTTNGPYIDAHFGSLTKKMPVGETYYARPLTEYMAPCKNGVEKGCGCGGQGKGFLKINIKDCIPFVHAQTNSVTKDLEVSGHIKISPFKFNKSGVAEIFPDQIIETNIKVKNFTNLPMLGVHIHDGVNKGLMTAFGQISYFLYTSDTWSKRFNMSETSVQWAKEHSPLPPTNTAIADNKTLLEYSNSIPIKKIKYSPKPHNKNIKYI
mgnify:CR=1 FL=1|tara:strand:+ start:168 stop:854 length:687 start_codon:yes stop_codon:yes gene_type:complete